MKFIRVFSTVSILLALFSCESEVVNTDLTMQMDDVQKALQSELLTPPGKLKCKYEFELFDNLIWRLDHYYDTEGKLTLSVQLIDEQDTGSVFLYDYDSKGRQISESWYDLKDGKYVLWQKLKKFYDQNGNLDFETIIEGVPARSYTYGPDGKLWKILMGDAKNGDCHIFDYGDDGRVSTMTWGDCAGASSPIMKYHYRYNVLGLLEAKEALQTGAIQREDAFQYFYNEKGQLIEEKEYYPQYGFVPRARRTFDYFPETSLSGN